jgi:RNA polymerase sigma factor (sigma-70 family)
LGQKVNAMANAQLGMVLRQVRRMAATEGLADATDGRLLEHFRAQQEEAAFGALLHRHGPMVLGVARRVLRQEQDAEDVVQATFLVLAQKAGSIRKRESVASWLHGVAYRLAVQAKGQRVRRQAHERQAGTMRHKQTNRQGAWQELEETLDQALAQLPAKYREAVVLCSLEGKTQEEASRQVGCPLGTVRSRLARGRELLRKQLAARGVTLSAGALATILAAGTASAALPAGVLRSTLRASLQAATGKAITGAVSPRALALLEGATRAMAMTKAKAMAALVVILSVLAAGAGVCARQALLGKNSAAEEERASQAKGGGNPKAEGENRAGTDRYGDPLPPGAVARLGTVRLRQGDLVMAVACSPDGRVVASRDRYGTFYLWDAGTGKLLRRVELAQAWLGGLAFFPGGKSLAVVGGWDGSVHFWDFASGREPVPNLKRVAIGPKDINRIHLHGSFTESFTASPDGKLVAGLHDNRICLWELATGKALGQLKPLRRFGDREKRWQRLAFSPGGKVLAAVGHDGGLSLWDPATGKELHRLEATVAARDTGSLPLAFSPDGKYLALGQPGGTLRLFDVAAAREVRVLNGQAEEVVTVAFAPDGKTLAFAARDNEVRLWDVAGRGSVRRFRGHRSWVMSVAFSPDGKRLVSGAQDCTVRIWDVASGRDVGPRGGNGFAVLALAVAPDGQTIATGAGLDDTIRLWDAATGKELRTIQARQGWVAALAFSPNGQWLASGGGRPDRSVCLWEAATGRPVRCFRGHRQGISNGCLAFSPDSKVLLSAGQDKTIRLWDVATGKELRTLAGHTGEVTCAAFSPDGRRVASAGWCYPNNPDAAIRIWDVATGKELRRLGGNKGGVSALAFSPDGRTLASAGGSFDPHADPDFAEALLLWDLATGKVLRRLAGAPRGNPGGRSIRSLAFSPDGKTLATGEAGHALFLYETASGRVRRELAGHHGDVYAVSFFPDGKLLASAGSDLSALIWDVAGRQRLPHRGVLPARELERMWTDLAGLDAAKAFRALQAMAAAAPEAVPLLKERLRPVAVSVDRPRLARLIADLDNSRFAVRRKATADLERLGELAERALLRALESVPSLEVRRRIEQLLGRIAKQRGRAPSPERLRTVRTVELLEQTGTAQARQVLEALARGTPEAWLTQEAKASLERLRRRPVSDR